MTTLKRNDMNNLAESKKLNDLIFEGTGSVEDTPLYCLIENLKQASLTCSELCVTAEYEDVAIIRDKLHEINYTLAETWRALSEVVDDVHTTKCPPIRQGSARTSDQQAVPISENTTLRK